MSNLTHSTGHGTGTGNLTLLLNPELCTLETCDLSMASFDYLPTVPGNAIYAAIFGVYVVAQLFLGIKHKTWGYMVAMVTGLLLEVIGYVGRVLLHSSPFNNNDFLIYLICLTIAPALLSASVRLMSQTQSLLLIVPSRSTSVSLGSSSCTARTSLASNRALTPSYSAPATSSALFSKHSEVPSPPLLTQPNPATSVRTSC